MFLSLAVVFYRFPSDTVEKWWKACPQPRTLQASGGGMAGGSYRAIYQLRVFGSDPTEVVVKYEEALAKLQ